uniref:Peptidase M16 N-terminal domain-containing protein n=1 Tax=Compsopogon caeruleus TaxID=31354 RepID=A0A7S1TES2_9RHOD|mmetsp:Transcript_3997/g.7703  ORF Transcript_3997/g.7703 Transcript_3997/m.7703 type:complete len:1148 (+) Transcript_3997:456-3899(+)
MSLTPAWGFPSLWRQGTRKGRALSTKDCGRKRSLVRRRLEKGRAVMSLNSSGATSSSPSTPPVSFTEPSLEARWVEEQVARGSDEGKVGAIDDLNGAGGVRELVEKEKFVDNLRLRVLRHCVSGARLATFIVPGPLCSATVIVRSLPSDNSGIPHCLEHLTFLGSKGYPHRGYLDTLATLSYSRGTNAYTAEDYTAYTLTTAGCEGLFQTLPVLLDHVLNPILSQESFVYEVYDGISGGVVYCEMKGRENTENDLLEYAWKKELFKGTFLDFDSGGRTQEIEKLSNDEIIAYHRKWYTNGANMSIIIGGADPLLCEKAQEITHTALIQIQRDLGLFQSVLSFHPQPFTETRFVQHSFPSASEEIGSVTISWRGPRFDDHTTIIALEVLQRYLAGNAASPLYQKFVETEEVMASEVSGEIIAFPITAIVLTFSGVPNSSDDDGEDFESDGYSGIVTGSEEEDHDGISVNDMPSLLDQHVLGNMVKELLGDIVTGEWPGGIEAVLGAIRKQKIRFLESIENDVHEFVPGVLIPDLLYGTQAGLGMRLMQELQILDDLENQDLSFWRYLLRKWMVDSPRLEIAMIPSCGLADSLSREDEVRNKVSSQILGENEVEGRNQAVQVATEFVQRSRQLAKQQVYHDPPVATSIGRIPYSVEKLKSTPFQGQLVTLDTNFVFISFSFDTQGLDWKERLNLPILSELLLASPLHLKDGTEVPYTFVTQRLSHLAVVQSVSTGVGAEFQTPGYGAECIHLEIGVERKDLEEVCDLVLDSLRFGYITIERVKTVAGNLHSFVVEDLRNGEILCNASEVILHEKLRRGEKPQNYSNAAVVNVFGQYKYLGNLLEAINNGNCSVVKEIQSIKERLVHGSNVMLQIASSDPHKSFDIFRTKWNKILYDDAFKGPTRSTSICNPINLARTPMTATKSIPSLVAVAEVGIESSFAITWVDCPLSKTDSMYPTMELICGILNRTEGVLYDAIRGAGLAYEANVTLRVWNGQLAFVLSESSDPSMAWRAFLDCLDRFEMDMDADSERNNLTREIEAAKASLLFSMHEQKSSPANIARTTYSALCRGMEAGRDAEMMTERAVESVSLHDIQSCFRRYFNPFRDPSARAMVIVGNPPTVESARISFRELGVELDILSTDDPSLHLPI